MHSVSQKQDDSRRILSLRYAAFFGTDLRKDAQDKNFSARERKGGNIGRVSLGFVCEMGRATEKHKPLFSLPKFILLILFFILVFVFCVYSSYTNKC